MIVAAAVLICVQTEELPVVFETDFRDRSLAGWTFTDPSAWRIEEEEGRPVLAQFAPSRYEPKVRSPLNRALLPTPPLGDLELEVEVRSTARDYGHRDVCLFLGYQDAEHFYYVHLAKEADDHANSIFLVNGAPRVSIAESRTSGTAWDDGWHRVRVVRTISDGMIRVYFDAMDRPVMTARDSTLRGPGRVGVGTFDDTAQFRRIRVRGRSVEP
ncbi:MAG: hypothetical protein KatS3mg108_3155 [Isosphaeraceae bacterium]|jgi:hypothetical protein|nr:MAG: hypothetical protein KatS3mg108_3155 [Isosphaeraceae bacterium]